MFWYNETKGCPSIPKSHQCTAIARNHDTPFRLDIRSTTEQNSGGPIVSGSERKHDSSALAG